MVQVTSHKILLAIRDLFVCLFAYYSKTNEWISMKLSGKTEDGTSKEPWKFLVAICCLGVGLCSPSALSEQRFALSECF